MKRMFRSMRAFLGKERDALSADNKTPFGLTAHEVALLRDLRDHEGYEVYLRRLDDAVNLYAERLLTSSDDAALHVARGAVIGLRNAASLVDETIQIHDRAADAERVRSSGAASAAAADSRHVATFGSASWRRGD